MFSMSLLALVASCGAGAYHKGRYLLDKGMYDDAVKQFQQAEKASPHNVKYKTALVRAKLTASQKHFDKGKMAMAHGDLDQAAVELDKTLQLDPGNQYARDTLQKVIETASEKEQEQHSTARMSLEQMKRKAEKNTGVPQLDPASNIPIVLKFKDTPLKTILDAISKASGINFLYDDKVDQNKRVTVDFAKVDLAQVLDYLMLQTKNFYKVLDPHSLIVVPDTKQKRDEYQDEVIRTFYLSNANAKDIFQLVRSILQVRKMAMNQELNSITIEDTPENVAVAQRIIENNDKSKGEVLVDVELLEVDSNLTRNLGINLDTNTFTIGPGHNVVTTTDSTNNTTSTSIGPGAPIHLNELGRTLSHNLWIAPVPNLIVNLLLSNSDTQVLAKPQLRVMEGQKASVHIGQRIPVPTSNQYLGSTGTSTTYTPITSYTYQDVGVKIEIEPKVHHNREVTLKMKTEVSSIAGYAPQTSGSLTSPQPILGTRDAQTTIRLEDGETSLLAGLIQKDDKKTLSGLPGISEIPFLRRLFSSTETKNDSTDVVMLVTPHIIRMPNITEQNLEPLYVGTANNPSVGGSQPSPFAAGPAVAPPSSGTPKNTVEAEPGSSTGDQSKSDEGNDTQKPGATPQAGRLLVSPTSIQATVGQPVIVNLVLIGAKELKGMQMSLNFPDGVLKFQGADEGTFFRMGGVNSNFSGQEAQPGTVGLNMARTDNSGASGSGLVARIRFVAEKAGTGKIEIAGAQATGVGDQPVPMPPAFATVTVSAAPPAPGGGGAKTGG